MAVCPGPRERPPSSASPARRSNPASAAFASASTGSRPGNPPQGFQGKRRKWRTVRQLARFATSSPAQDTPRQALAAGIANARDRAPSHHERRRPMDRMLVVVFDNEAKAYEGKKALMQLDGEGSIGVYGYAVLAKNA